MWRVVGFAPHRRVSARAHTRHLEQWRRYLRSRRTQMGVRAPSAHLQRCTLRPRYTQIKRAHTHLLRSYGDVAFVERAGVEQPEAAPWFRLQLNFPLRQRLAKARNSVSVRLADRPPVPGILPCMHARVDNKGKGKVLDSGAGDLRDPHLKKSAPVAFLTMRNPLTENRFSPQQGYRTPHTLRRRRMRIPQGPESLRSRRLQRRCQTRVSEGSPDKRNIRVVHFKASQSTHTHDCDISQHTPASTIPSVERILK